MSNKYVNTADYKINIRDKEAYSHHYTDFNYTLIILL